MLRGEIMGTLNSTVFGLIEASIYLNSRVPWSKSLLVPLFQLILRIQNLFLNIRMCFWLWISVFSPSSTASFKMQLTNHISPNFVPLQTFISDSQRLASVLRWYLRSETWDTMKTTTGICFILAWTFNIFNQIRISFIVLCFDFSSWRTSLHDAAPCALAGGEPRSRDERAETWDATHQNINSGFR